MERAVNSGVRTWLSVPHCLSSIVGLEMTLDESKDTTIQATTPKTVHSKEMDSPNVQSSSHNLPTSLGTLWANMGVEDLG